jgi:hypothetical protein
MSEKGEPVGVLSLSLTSTQFSRWRLRFKAHCREVNAALLSLFEPSVTDGAAERPLRELFSSLLIRFIGDDVLEFFLPIVNIEEKPLSFFSLITKHFASLSSTEECSSEIFFSVLRSRRNHFPSLSAFIASLQRAAALISSSYSAPSTQQLSERLLVLHLISNLNSAAWANGIISAARVTMRKDPSEPLSLSDFCTSLLQACPFDPEVGASHSSEASSSSSSSFRPRHGDRERERAPLPNSPSVGAASVNCVMTITDDTYSFLSDASGVAERDPLNSDVWHFKAERYE